MSPKPVLAALALLLGACATAQPDTPKQAKTRADLEACRTAGGSKAYDLRVTPEGRYSLKAPTSIDSQAVVDCMRGKGYSSERR